MLGSSNQIKIEEPKQEIQCLELLLQRKFQEVFSEHVNLKPDQAFYLEASKLYISCVEKKIQVDNIKREIDKLHRQIGIQIGERKKVGQSSHHHTFSQENSERKKRVRRTAVEIARHYVCEVDRCNKSYGSEGSLHQHMKLKHKHIYSKQLLMMGFENNL